MLKDSIICLCRHNSIIFINLLTSIHYNCICTIPVIKMEAAYLTLHWLLQSGKQCNQPFIVTNFLNLKMMKKVNIYRNEI